MKICAIGLRGIPDVMGGIETHCEHLYPRLASLDETLDIVVIGRSGHAPTGQFGKIRVVSLWAPKQKALETLIHTPLAILWARLFLHPDVIHLHAIGPGFFAPLARALGFRVIATHHAADYDRPKWGRFGKWFLKAGERMIAVFANDVICVSSTIEEDLSRRYPAAKGRTVTIRNGAPPAKAQDMTAIDPLAQFQLTRGGYILGVGRLDPTKGFHDLVRAFQTAKPKGMKLVIAGGAPDGDAYAGKLRGQAAHDIVFTGPLPAESVRALYRNAALFVHPSYLEGFAMVVLEAVEANVPMLVTDIPAHREVGLDASAFYMPGDVTVLANRLASGVYDALRCSGRDTILRENDWATVAERHREIIIRHAPPKAKPRQKVRQPPAHDVHASGP
ncbi:MAG TPA: glycosyltransferase family 4 protein [Hyphomonadaceae bacterium]|nr:glycosyltransferase family 4 protein [Hyphomonadaceae bacterium]